MQSIHLTPYLSIAIIIAAVACSLTIIISNFLFVYKKREKNHFQALQLIESQHEKDILISRNEMQEETLKYIAREIHDNINLSLTLAKLYLNTIPWDQSEKSKMNVGSAVETLTKSIADLNALSKSSNADVINAQGLIAALDNEIERIRRIGLFDVDYQVYGEPVYLNSQKEIVIFRIIQESFNNIIKHSAATRTSLQLDFRTDELNIRIEDNGKGFCNKNNTSKSGAGLHNMKARAALIGGEMHVKSEPTAGVIIQLKIPT